MRSLPRIARLVKQICVVSHAIIRMAQLRGASGKNPAGGVRSLHVRVRSDDARDAVSGVQSLAVQIQTGQTQAIVTTILPILWPPNAASAAVASENG